MPVLLYNGDDVRVKHIPCGYNYNIADHNFILPLKFPLFSSEGQARGTTINYRIPFSPLTWYLNGKGPPHIRLGFILYVYTEI